MSQGLPWNSVPVAVLSLLLGACGAGSSPFPPSDPAPVSNDAPSSDGSEQSPTSRYSAYYRGIGLQPNNLEDGLLVDEAVASAVVPGYLGFATLMASMDLRMPLQAYEWYLPRAVERAGEISDEGTQDAPYPGRMNVSCADTNSEGHVLGEGEVTIFHWHNSNGSTSSDGAASYSRGEEIRFGFNNCVPTSTAARFSSDGLDVARPRVQRYVQIAGQNGQPHYRFTFDGISLLSYPGFTISGGPLVRHTVVPGPTADMVLSNAVLETGEAPGSLALSGNSDGRVVSVYMQGRDRDPSTAVSEMHSVIAPEPPQHLDFAVPLLNVGLEIEGEESSLEGDYHFSTQSAVVAFRNEADLAAGGFKVVRPATGASYSFELDADPAFLRVQIDEDGDGAVDASGRISKPLVVNRLALADAQ